MLITNKVNKHALFENKTQQINNEHLIVDSVIV